MPSDSLCNPNIFLSLGSNVGDRHFYLNEAIRLLGSSGLQVCQVSPIYLTEPVDFKHQEWFLNQVLSAETILKPEELLLCCLNVEEQLERKRAVPRGPRTIDVDVLLYCNAVVKTETLEIPHPKMHLRRFVLEPLAQIAPQLVHPVLKQSVSSLLEQCADPSIVIREKS